MIKTVEQYLESLNDGREVWCLGEKVKDVRTHPTVSTIVRVAAMDYVLPNHPDFRDLFVTKDQDGEDINFLLTAPKSVEDMLRRRECYTVGVRSGGGVMVHCMGADALAAFAVAAQVMDKNLGTNYTERVKNYQRYLQKNDLGITGAITDVKGDRSLHPSKQKQHKDYYLRIVDRQKDGIVVSGAKVHISSSPCANELLCLPCRTHGEDDKDYALAFAVPVSTPGVKLLGVEPNFRLYDGECEWDYPLSDHFQPSESLIVFDNVFVPWERVFMCGEWQYSQILAYAFASYHRLFGTCKMTGTLEIMTGAAHLIAEYNGVQNAPHVRKKLAWMAYITETVQMLGKQACLEPITEFGMDTMMPNRMAINASKWTYASNIHTIVQHMQDIGGGLATTVPAYRDWKNPEIQPYIEKYLGAKDGIPTEQRLRILRLIKDVTGNHIPTDTIHGEGSMAAQEMFLYTSANWKKMRSAALRAAYVDGWQDDPIYGKLPTRKGSVNMPPIDESYESFAKTAK
ncbi:MAG: 4-hydroxybutyryl-CoA dehydratase [Deltaproteobacteria bacterium]|nr:4-hydroxybutyryl-CoA dehydratase [Deltaproteobacteria bacterium]